MDLMAYVPHFSEAPNVESTPVIQHVCEQPSEEDEVENVMPGNSIGARLQRWFLRKRILSRKHHLTHWSLKSTTAVNYEISRHVKSHPYMIHPFSSFCIFWELFMTLFTIVALLITPVSITFYFNHQGDWHLLNDVMNIVFFCDIIVWFFTGYYDYRTKVIVLDPRIVALKYLRKYFLVDVLTAPPIGLIQMVMPNMTWFCTTLNMMKFLRIRNITVYSHRLHGVYRIKYQLHKILDTSLIVFMTIHWASCLEYYVPMSVNYLGTLSNESWIKSESFLSKTTTREQYILCMNRAVTALLRSAHYLDMKTPEDIILNLILTVTGFIGFVYVLTQFSDLLTTFHITIKRNLKIVQQLQEYMRYKELPQALQRRLLEYYHYRNKKRFERDKKIIEEVSPCLREELILHNYLRLISNVKLFEYLPESVVAQLASSVRSEIYMPGDKIVKAGTRGESLYFITSGTVAIYTSTGKEICHLEDGSYFGEIALVMETELRIATVIAVETCEICVLDRGDFRRYISRYPDLLNRLQNVALQNLENSPILGKTHDLHTSPRHQYINISSIKRMKKTDRDRGEL
ncbi:PREDICTED: potassium/sodium hyperpolarization-activated cyclic nucleotide-gated channel 1-like [Dufourea novaeangliae]|uniref:potassium/sodium hyperpolarization-activated cyclic nucleotide-gated channel 1-like n=1 Tax=Dufourea novaeangliae TaxID=178035 RepID=UPI000766E7CB|nr:PREDICTED: potassium/sodium hyperpolarization-activated cyclic nucleotide-gated channel 1-like [Dufourea novaeangliae]